MPQTPDSDGRPPALGHADIDSMLAMAGGILRQIKGGQTEVARANLDTLYDRLARHRCAAHPVIVTRAEAVALPAESRVAHVPTVGDALGTNYWVFPADAFENTPDNPDALFYVVHRAERALAVGDPITTASQLERLGAGSIVELREVFGVAWCSAPGRWVLSGIPDPMTSDDVVTWLPGTVRRVGGAA